MSGLTHLLPLLLAAAILLAGNGLQGTLITLRANLEGFDPALIGLLGTAYFVGFACSCLMTPHLIRSVGHIRVFSALAALAAGFCIAKARKYDRKAKECLVRGVVCVALGGAVLGLGRRWFGVFADDAGPFSGSS